MGELFGLQPLPGFLFDKEISSPEKTKKIFVLYRKEHNDVRIKNFIKNSIHKYTTVAVVEEDRNLLDDDLEIEPIDFLYVFDDIEKTYGIHMGNVMKKISVKEFALQNLTKVVSQQI